MHILAGLLAAIGTIAYILWRLHSAAQATKGLVETADDLHTYLKQKKRGNLLVGSRLDTVADARVAATAMMVALAQSDGALLEREETTIMEQAMAKFAVDQDLAQELLAHSRWLVAEIKDLDTCFMRLTPIILRSCDREQRTDLLEMLEAVAAHASDSSKDLVGEAISRLRNRLD